MVDVSSLDEWLRWLLLMSHKLKAIDVKVLGSYPRLELWALELAGGAPHLAPGRLEV